MRKRAKKPVMAVQLQRKHLDMVKYFADDEDKRYVASRLHVRRTGDDVAAQATDGAMAATLTATLVDASELPAGLPGEALADGAVVTVDAETVKNAVRMLSKKLPELLQHAYLTVEKKIVCLTVFTPMANVLRVPETGAGVVPDPREEHIKPAGPLRLCLSAYRLGSICDFVYKHADACDSIVMDFSVGGYAAAVRIEWGDDFLAVLMPFRKTAQKRDGSPEPSMHPETWEAAIRAAAKSEKKMEVANEA